MVWEERAPRASDLVSGFPELMIIPERLELRYAPAEEPPLILVIGELENRVYSVPVTFSRGLLHTPQAPRPHESRKERVGLADDNQ